MSLMRRLTTNSERTNAWINANAGTAGYDNFGDQFDELSYTDEEVNTAADAESFESGPLTKNNSPGFWDSVTNKGLHPDDTAQWLKRFEAGADLHIIQTYERTKPVQTDLSAPCPQVKLVFLPGADKPTVTRLEGAGMVEKQPDQKNATWRVNTAGSLLTSSTVDRNLSFVTEDRTRKVMNAIPGYSEPFFGQARKVTIDSSRVEITNELRDENGNVMVALAATLIEVHTSSLVKLITHFKYLLDQSTPHMTPAYHVQHLEDMMEAARLFYTRSPILFRMSTRTRIINSVDIRYGYDDEQGFTTVYPGKGIQQLINVTASYFNALDPEGTTLQQDKTQALVRSRFLQMLVLLLSMLSNADVRQMAEFLEKTYGIRSNREELELLFIKVIPLASINSKVFLSSLVPAVYGQAVPTESLEDEEQVWNVLLLELAKKGYLLPATVDELGHETNSWLAKWPADGIRSTQIFGKMQLDGKTLKGFNEVLPISLASDSDAKEMTVYLHNLEKPYVIDTQDYDPIQSLRPGRYTMRDAEEGGSEVELHIKAQSLNEYANRAIKLINTALTQINSQATRPNNRLVRFRPGKSTPDVPFIIARDLPTESGISRHEAWLENTSPYLAISWQCDGKSISRRDMLNRMSRGANRIYAVVQRFERMTGGKFGRHDGTYQQIIACLNKHEAMMQQERNTRPQTGTFDTPIRHTIFPNDDQFGLPNIWFEYESEYRPRNQRLSIKSQRDIVESVRWISNDTQAEVTLVESRIKFVVVPLRPDLKIPVADEIQRGDLALLCGRYMVVAVIAKRTPRVAYNGEDIFEMTNWLEIHSVDEQAQPRRGRNRAGKSLQETIFV